MGYKTKFSGELKFTKDLTVKELAKVKTFLGEDCRKHPEWESRDLYWIELEFLNDFTGLKWNNSEGTSYGMVECVNLIINQTRKEFPDFGLSGSFLAQGEDMDDRWWLVIENGQAIRRDFEIEVKCPHCGHQFNTIKS